MASFGSDEGGPEWSEKSLGAWILQTRYRSPVLPQSCPHRSPTSPSSRFSSSRVGRRGVGSGVFPGNSGSGGRGG